MNMKRIPVYEPSLDGNELTYVTECIRSGWISSQGRYVDEFEAEFASYCGCRFGVATSSGTTALHLALVSLGVGAGHEVIIPTLTFVATANAVSYTGAEVQLCDVSRKTWTIDCDSLSRLLSPATRAVVVVHLYGQPAEMELLRTITDRAGVPIIEDAAESHGARTTAGMVGGLGRVGVFSFYGNKIITTGEGGMLTTNDAALAERARHLRDHAMSPDKRYLHTEVGFNYRMTNLQAAVGLAQLERIDELLERKRWVEGYYREGLQDVEAIEWREHQPWSSDVPWLVTCQYDGPVSALREALSSRGIETRPLFVPMHRQPMYARQGQFEAAESISRRGLSLPSSPTLTEADLERVCTVIHDFERGRTT